MINKEFDSSKTFRSIRRFLKDHYEEMLAIIFFMSASTLAFLTSLGRLIIPF